MRPRTALLALGLVVLAAADSQRAEAGAPGLPGAAAAAGAPAQVGPRVETRQGPVLGVRGDTGFAWLGVPFAAPPLGSLRWRAPEAPPDRTEALDATAYGPSCPQSTGSGQTEDCLQLNIWAPLTADSSEPAPVMVWIHGGGMVQGSGTLSAYDGADLAAGTGTVVVTINYRLAALGFLAHESFTGEDPALPGAGNYGLMDQVAALEWVRDNIAAFGGDPERVLIAGESAGGVSVCALMAVPSARGLFRAAAMQSGNCLAALLSAEPGAEGPATAFEQGARFAQEIGCATVPDVAACLRAKPLDTIMATLPGEVGILDPGAETYGPVRDGTFLAEAPGDALRAGRSSDVPFIVGATADEGTVFVGALDAITAAQYEAAIRTLYGARADDILTLYPADAYARPSLALADVTGDALFVCPARWAAAVHSAHGNDAYLYHFAYVPAYATRAGIGAHHGVEIPFLFGLSQIPPPLAPARAISEAMQHFWSSLAATGRPGEHAGLRWPLYDQTDQTLLFADPMAIATGIENQRCDLWDEVAGRDVPEPQPSPPAPTPTRSAATVTPGPRIAIYLPLVQRDHRR